MALANRCGEQRMKQTFSRKRKRDGITVEGGRKDDSLKERRPYGGFCRRLAAVGAPAQRSRRAGFISKYSGNCERVFWEVSSLQKGDLIHRPLWNKKLSKFRALAGRGLVPRRRLEGWAASACPGHQSGSDRAGLIIREGQKGVRRYVQKIIKWFEKYTRRTGRCLQIKKIQAA